MRWGLQVMPNALVVRLYGLLDQSCSDMWEKAAQRSLSLDKRKIILDFSGVESVAPLGVVLCGYGLHHLQELSINVGLIRPPSTLLPVLQSHGLKRLPAVLLQEQDVCSKN